MTDLPVSLIWQAVFNYPEGMEGWQAYRIEYGGHAERCVMEGTIWLPPDTDPRWIAEILRGRMNKEALAWLVEQAQEDN